MKCRFIESDYVNTSNALTLGMSGEQIGLQVPPTLELGAEDNNELLQQACTALAVQ